MFGVRAVSCPLWKESLTCRGARSRYRRRRSRCSTWAWPRTSRCRRCRAGCGPLWPKGFCPAYCFCSSTSPSSPWGAGLGFTTCEIPAVATEPRSALSDRHLGERRSSYPSRPRPADQLPRGAHPRSRSRRVRAGPRGNDHPSSRDLGYAESVARAAPVSMSPETRSLRGAALPALGQQPRNLAERQYRPGALRRHRLVRRAQLRQTSIERLTRADRHGRCQKHVFTGRKTDLWLGLLPLRPYHLRPGGSWRSEGTRRRREESGRWRPDRHAHGRIRTCDTWLRRPVLYPLSYVGAINSAAGCRAGDAPLYPFEPCRALVRIGDESTSRSRGSRAPGKTCLASSRSSRQLWRELRWVSTSVLTPAARADLCGLAAPSSARSPPPALSRSRRKSIRGPVPRRRMPTRSRPPSGGYLR